MDTSKLDTRKKAIFAIAFVLFVFVLWQGFNVVTAKEDKGDKFYAKHTAAPFNNSTRFARNKTNVPHLREAATDAPNNQAPSAPPPPPRATITQIPAPAINQGDVAQFQQTRMMRMQYTRLVNQFQLLQLQAQVAKAQAELAKNRNAITQEDLKMAQGRAALAEFEGTATGEPAAFKVSYIGKDAGRWTAILASGKQYFDVVEGTVLPQGVEVVSITPKTVLLQDKDERHLLRLPITSVDLMQRRLPVLQYKDDSPEVKAAVPPSTPGYVKVNFSPEGKTVRAAYRTRPQPAAQPSGRSMPPPGARPQYRDDDEVGVDPRRMQRQMRRPEPRRQARPVAPPPAPPVSAEQPSAVPNRPALPEGFLPSPPGPSRPRLPTPAPSTGTGGSVPPAPSTPLTLPKLPST